jgi:soluble lytic murein transglycosylase
LAASLSILSGTAGIIEPNQERLPDGLDPLIRNYTPAVENALKGLKQGVEHFLNRRYALALEVFPDEPKSGVTAVADYMLLYRAKTSLMLEKADEALRLFKFLEQRYPDSSQRSEAILGECQALLKLRRPDAVLENTAPSRIEQSPRILYFRARALEDMGKRAQAVSLYLRLFAQQVASDVSLLAAERLQQVSPGFQVRAGNYTLMLERAENLLRAGRNREARTVLLRLAQVRASEGASSELRRLLFAEAEFRLGSTATALSHLKRISSADPNVGARSLYLQAACYRRLEREDAFLAARDQALRLYPESPYTERLLHSVATYFDVNNRIDEAYGAYNLLVARFPQGEYVEFALRRSSLFAYVQQRYGEALQGYWRLLLARPETPSVCGTIYWIGRCYEKAGDRSSAAYLYDCARRLGNDSYYGQLSLQARRAIQNDGPASFYHPPSGIDSSRVREMADRLSIPRISISQPSGPVALSVERARQLAAADLPDLALEELRWTMQRYPDNKAVSYVTSLVYALKRDHYGAIVTLRRAFPDYSIRPISSLPQEVWDLLFPRPYRETILAQATKNDLDPDLILGIIRQESAFRETARSPANAHGLMQVLPSTGRSLARRTGITPYTVKKLQRPEVNVALGTRHLGDLLQRFGNRVELALAAYNAGIDRVDRWTENFGKVDRAEFVERIPFSETREYVKQVMTNAAYYRLLNDFQAGMRR